MSMTKEQRKAAVDRYNHSEKGRAARARYAQTDKGKAAEQRKYAKLESRRWSETVESAHHRGDYWTAAEIEQGMRDDIPLKQLAEQLGRTYGALRNMRARCRRGDLYIRDEASVTLAPSEPT